MVIITFKDEKAEQISNFLRIGAMAYFFYKISQQEQFQWYDSLWLFSSFSYEQTITYIL
jgi:hypothetical protein